MTENGKSLVRIVVDSALNSWTSLQLAIQHGMAGGNEAEKLSNLAEDLVFLCDTKAERHDFEETLEAVAFHDFNIIDEDGSFKDLANAILTCLRELETSPDSTATITKHFPCAKKALAASQKGESQEGEVVEDETALSEIVERTTIREEPLVDEDGFTMVQRRKKR